MKRKLITALRVAANALEQDTLHYDWEQNCSCNCGVLACAVMGVSERQLDAHIDFLKPNRGVTWTEWIGSVCPVTGKPNHTILNALFAAGMVARDIPELEYLDNPNVVEQVLNSRPRRWFGLRAPKPLQEGCKEDVIDYMRAWADCLTEEGQLDSPSRERIETKEFSTTEV